MSSAPNTGAPKVKRRRTKRADRTGARAVKVRDRRQEMLDRRRGGQTYTQIAREMGYAVATVHEGVTAMLDEMVREPAEAVRKLELDRLDALLAGIWKGAIRGDVQAQERALKIMERRARLLGLDAPSRSELSGPDGKAIAVEQSEVSAEDFEDLAAAVGYVVTKRGEKPEPDFATEIAALLDAPDEGASE